MIRYGWIYKIQHDVKIAKIIENYKTFFVEYLVNWMLGENSMKVLSLSFLSREIIAFAKVFTKKDKRIKRNEKRMLNAKSKLSINFE